MGDRDALTRELEAGSSEMGAEGREPSGEDRGWKLGDGSSELEVRRWEIGTRWRGGGSVDLRFRASFVI